MNLQVKIEDMQMRIIFALLFAVIIIPIMLSEVSAKCVDENDDCRSPFIFESLKEQINRDVSLSDIICSNRSHTLVERPNGKLACLTPHTLERTWKQIDYAYIDDYKAFRTVQKENRSYDIPFEIKGAVLEGFSFEDNSLVITTRSYAEKGTLSFQIQYDLLDASSENCDLDVGPLKTSYFAVINDIRKKLDKDQKFHGTPVNLMIPLDEHSKTMKIIHACDNSQEKNSKISGTLDDYSEKTFKENNAYELNEALCLGGPSMILNEKCERIGKYNTQTGIPIVENKTQCDLLNGNWYDDHNKCDSTYAPVEYRFQFGYSFLGYEKPQICTDEMMKHLAIYSNMFADNEEEYSLDWIGLGDHIDSEDFDVCESKLLELR